MCLQTFKGRIDIYKTISLLLVTSQSCLYLTVMSCSLAEPSRTAGDGLRFVPCSSSDMHSLHRRKMIFPVITHCQMPCLIFFLITTVREKLANPWSSTCQNTLQSWHNLDLVPSSSAMAILTFICFQVFLSAPFLISTFKNSLKTHTILKLIYKPAKAHQMPVWLVCQIKENITYMTKQCGSLRGAGGEGFQKCLGS